MNRLGLIVFCHLSVYFGWFFCELLYPGKDEDYVNLWDLMRHNVYYISIIAAVWMDSFEKEPMVEKHVIFLKFVYIWGVLVNCIIFNLQNDRNFHWYSIALIALSFGGGIKIAYPKAHNFLYTTIPFYKLFFLWSKN